MKLLPPERYAKYLLIGLYLLIVASLALRIKVEATHYTTPDSYFYLGSAKMIQEGHYSGDGLNPFANEPEQVYHFAVWPIGYPLLIYALSTPTNISLLVASKLVNLLFLGLIFLLLYKWYRNLAWFPALFFLSINMLEVYSYTWAEGAFLFFVLYLSHLVQKDLQGTYSPFFFVELFLCLASLFLLRYAGLVYFFFAALYLLRSLYLKDYVKSRHYFIALALASCVVMVYFLINYQHTGYYSGGDRVFPYAESLSAFTYKLFVGLFNEFAIARNYYFRDYFDPLFIGLLLLQLVLFLYVLLQLRRFGLRRKSKSFFSHPLVQLSFFYLLAILILRKISPFDAFNYRILAPFSLPLFIYLFGTLARTANSTLFQRVYPWITAFMLLSLLMNLPKAYLLEQFFG